MNSLMELDIDVVKHEFSKIPLLKWGNEITIKGVLMGGVNEETYLVSLPTEKVAGDLIILNPTSEEWYELQDQLDKCNVEGENKIILRKGQRLLDAKISWEVFKRDKYKCRYCAIDHVPLTVDHIITWESGGATHVDNLLTSCKKCNRKRGNLDYGSWLQHKYYLDRSKYLTEEERGRNNAIVFNLSILPRMAKPRNR